MNIYRQAHLCQQALYLHYIFIPPSYSMTPD
jgi:hypothetical protein